MNSKGNYERLMGEIIKRTEDTPAFQERLRKDWLQKMNENKDLLGEQAQIEEELYKTPTEYRSKYQQSAITTCAMFFFRE